MKPNWLTIRPPKKPFRKIKKILSDSKLHTVCQESHCPNMPKCWDRNTITFLIMGDKCTRHCKFCTVKPGKPEPLDKQEPTKMAETAKRIHSKYVVLTSVDRDDLPDKGASHFANCTAELKRNGIKAEALIPDYQENELKILLQQKPDVVAHNIEVVKRLQPTLRDRRASYKKSLNTLKTIKKLSKGTITKSSLMLGLGETEKEIIQTMKDLKKSGVDIITIGQYLPPSEQHAQVKKYYSPKEFSEYEKTAKKLGFKIAVANPFVRSSFRAGEAYAAYNNS